MAMERSVPGDGELLPFVDVLVLMKKTEPKVGKMALVSWVGLVVDNYVQVGW